MKTFEDSYVKTLKKDPAAAQKSLDDFNIQVIADAEALTADLMNQVFTIRTADIQKDNFFANRKRRINEPVSLPETSFKLSSSPEFTFYCKG